MRFVECVFWRLQCHLTGKGCLVRQKINTKCTFPHELDLWPYTSAALSEASPGMWRYWWAPHHERPYPHRALSSML